MARRSRGEKPLGTNAVVFENAAPITRRFKAAASKSDPGTLIGSTKIVFSRSQLLVQSDELVVQVFFEASLATALAIAETIRSKFP